MDSNRSEHINGSNIEDWNTQLAYSFIPLDVILGFYFIFGVFGNLLVLYIYSAKMKVKMDDRFFIQTLATADILVCLVAPTFCLTRNILPLTFNYGQIVCTLGWFVSKVLNAISVMLILLIGVQRYLKICRPFGRQMDKRHNKVAVVTIIIMCLISHAPIFIFYGEIPIHLSLALRGSHCGRIQDGSPNFQLLSYTFLVVVFCIAIVCLIVISLLYTLTWKRITGRLKRKESRLSSTFKSHETQTKTTMSDVREDSTKSACDSMVSVMNSQGIDNMATLQRSPKHRKSSKTKHKYTIMFILISGICIVSYTPTLIVNISVEMDSTEFWTSYHPSLRVVCLFLFQMYLINHVANPFIYGFFDSVFREEVKQMFSSKK